METSETVRLLERWRAGHEDAAAQLFERYAGRLIGLAQQRLSAKLGARVDPGDVVQSAYCTFFLGARDGRFVLQQSGDLWRLLVGITLHKLQRQFEYHTAAKRSVHRENSLAEGDDLLARDPSPEDAALLVTTLDETLAALPEGHRKILARKLQGDSVSEIVVATGYSSSTVRRVLDRVQEFLEGQ